MTEQPSFDPSKAFDPNYTFPPVVPPIGHELSNIERAAALAETTCPHCQPTLEPHYHQGLLRSVGIGHEKGCPDYVE